MRYFFFFQLMIKIVILLLDNLYFFLLYLLIFLEFFDLDLCRPQLNIQLFYNPILFLQKSHVALPFELQLLLQLLNIFLQLLPFLHQLFDLMFKLIDFLADHLRSHIVDLFLLFGNSRNGADLEHVERPQKQVLLTFQLLRFALSSTFHPSLIEVKPHLRLSSVLGGINRLYINLLLLLPLSHLFLATRDAYRQLKPALLTAFPHSQNNNIQTKLNEEWNFIDDYFWVIMRQTGKDQQEKKVQFSEILRQKKLKLQRDQRVLDRLVKNRANKLQSHIINPQRLFQEENNKNSSQLDSKSQEKIDKGQQGKQAVRQVVEQSAKLEQMRGQYLLRQKAQDFILRLRKQKQYNKGKMMVVRRKEQSRRQEEKTKLEEARKVIAELCHRKRVSQMMTNIMLHRERISFRADQSAVRQIRKSHIRSNTQNAPRYQSEMSFLHRGIHQLPKRNTPIKNISALPLLN